jgi:hypothetical protein
LMSTDVALICAVLKCSIEDCFLFEKKNSQLKSFSQRYQGHP